MRSAEETERTGRRKNPENLSDTVVKETQSTSDSGHTNVCGFKFLCKQTELHCKHGTNKIF